MITDEVGKILVNTQDEIKLLKSELDAFQNPFTSGTPHEYKQMINRIKDQLSRFEEKIGNKVDSLITNEMVNHDETLNKLPLITKSDAYIHKDSFARSLPTFESMNAREKENKRSSKTDPRFLFMQKLVNNPTSDITKKLLKEKFSLPVAESSKMKPYSTLKPLQKSKTSKSLKLAGKTSGPVGILPKEVRNNPFAVPPIREKDIKHGVLNLIYRGLVPKEVDLTPAFERGAPALGLQKMTLHNHKEQYIRGEISTVPAYLSNIKFDLKNLDQPLHPETNPARTSNSFSPLVPYEPRSASNRQNPGFGSTKIDYNFDKTKAKDYDEVMDTYSLHQFIIRKGHALMDTPEFQSYQRTYFGIWDSIINLVQELEKVLGDYDVKVAYIDGKKLAKLAEVAFGKPTIQELLDCVVNQQDINKIITIPQNMFRGANGKNLAATKVQSFWRMFKARKTYRRVKVLIDKVHVIQRFARLFLEHKKTAAIIKSKKEQYFAQYKEIAHRFQEEWPQIKLKRRVEIHIQSISCDETQRLSMEKFLQKQNAQIARLFALKDPLVEIIYIAPFNLPPEVLSYYSKVFELGGLDSYQTRYTIIWPDNHSAFPGHFPTSKVLMYSPKTLKRIKQLIQGKTAYIVPSLPSNDDVELSVMLNVPLFSGDPQKNALYSTKSGAKEIFNTCGMPIPTGSFNIYDEKEFILTLTKLIAYNFHVNTWLFKIDDEFSGRGHATFNIEQVRPLIELRNRKLPVNEDLILKIHEIVASLLPHKIKIAMPHLYKNYNEYITNFVQKGGVIEATPNCLPSQVSSSSVGFIIDPVGNVELLGSYDKFFAHEYVACGYFFPQKSIPNLNLQTICETIGKTLFERGVFGYASLDIISFPDPSAKKQEKGESGGLRAFWAMDLNCYMTTYVASTLFFDFLMRGQMDNVSGLYTIPKPISDENEGEATKPKGKEAVNNEEGDDREKRCFMYCPFIYHQGLSSIQYKTFFHLCRMNGISYDLESKAGTTFILLDSLQTGIMGVITMGRYRRTVVKYMNDALNFILTQGGQNDVKHHDGSGETSVYRPDTMHLPEIASRVRLISRVFEKKHRKIN